MKKIVFVSALVALSTAASLATAATATANFDVKLTVQKACAVSAGNAIDFGAVSSSSTADLAGQTTINVTCSKATPYTIGLKSLNNSSSVTGAGSMKAATQGNNDTVGYQLRQTTGTGGAVWGSTIGSNTIAGTGNGAAQPRTVFATLPGANLNVQADDYKDTVTVSVEY